MKPLRNVPVPVRPAPRFYWALAILIVVSAAASAASAFAVVAGIGFAALAVALILDVSLGPSLESVGIERVEARPFTLRHATTVAYRVTNVSHAWIRVGIAEAPSRTIFLMDADVRAVFGPDSTGIVHQRVLPVERGSDSLPYLYVWIENAAGLLRRFERRALPLDVRVYPDLSAVERYGALHVRNRTLEAGFRRIRLRGAGTEVEGVREWGSGDAFRAINWKATARRGRMMVCEYEVERSQNITIVLDAGRLMTAHVGPLRKFDYAVTAALSIASIAAISSDKVGLVAFASRILRALPPRGTRRSSELAAHLYDLEPRFEESDYEEAFAYVRAHARKRSLIVLFTDMVDPVAQSSVLGDIGTLCKRHLVVCAFLNDAAIDRALEREPANAGEAYRMGVALELRHERRAAAAVLERLGVQVIDVPAADLTTALIDRYLRIKQRGLL